MASATGFAAAALIGLQRGRSSPPQLSSRSSSASRSVTTSRRAGPILASRMQGDDETRDEIKIKRREALQAASLGLAALLVPPPHEALAVSLADVTPEVAPPGKLSPSEEAIISVFEKNTISVVNIFDVTLAGRAAARVDAETPEGNGTGFVWDKEGNIVTNYHVLGNVLKGLGDNANGKLVAKISLLGSDGFQQTFDAVLVGSDKRKDLAVVKINAPQDLLMPVQLGSSQALKVGQLCLAIGNPFGFDHTLTTGTISGLGRDIQSQVGSVIGGGIQTDAAINPGNSGGPLLNSQGQVVGVNTAIFTNSGTSAGVGFAIPIDTVGRTVPQLVQFGKVVQPSLKLQIAPDRVAQALRVKQGALIQSMEPDSPAAKAGLLPTRRGLSGVIAGDAVVGINGRPIKTSGELGIAVDECSVGDEVELEVLRDGEKMRFKVKLESA